MSRKEKLEKEKLKIETTRKQYRDELSEVEKILETSNNELLTLRTDRIYQQQEQENQLKERISFIDENISMYS